MDREFVEEYLDYKEGSLWWKKNRSTAKAGQRFGTPNEGYRQGSVQGKIYKEHHIIWFIHYGYVPLYLDHINGVRDDNRIENLREADDQTNSYNKPKTKLNKSGYKGVSWHKASKGWIAQIQNCGKKEHIGCFQSKEEAAQAYNEVATKYYGNYARLNEV